ncbi:glycine betaine ABC transporter substrate-binding protein [Asaia krungthepensis]|uniref:ABC-type glycine betaine transport system substrate-binding domain-containing protein n=1 Tax=Asaia krungthepensis NRIC 0535 TaxID=1307925 RepID=A0ABQ0PY60_9PROT|nr:glycine betaine ABC transporter substrate-binding protein [Asaia krungthepensis]GBQ84523.1 hypothetical protein AA0535_0519 [Asaia krungthepensis NRIC 0535]
MTTISLGYLGTALHAGCASAVARVLDAHEVEVDFVDSDESELPGMLEEGAIDLLVSAWLPRDAHLVQYGMRVLGTLYRPFYCWASFETVSSLSGLSAGEIDVAITSRSDQKQMEVLIGQTDALAGVTVEICDEEALYAAVHAARDAGRKALVFLAQPHALFNDEAFRTIDDPNLPGEMEGCMLVRESVAACADQDMLDELSEMTLGNKVMSAMDHAIQVDGMDPEEAAEAWQRGRLVAR